MGAISPTLAVEDMKETIEGMSNFMVTSQKIDIKTAEGAAKEHTSKLPAWRGEVRFERRKDSITKKLP